MASLDSITPAIGATVELCYNLDINCREMNLVSLFFAGCNIGVICQRHPRSVPGLSVVTNLKKRVAAHATGCVGSAYQRWANCIFCTAAIDPNLKFSAGYLTDCGRAVYSISGLWHGKIHPSGNHHTAGNHGIISPERVKWRLDECPQSRPIYFLKRIGRANCPGRLAAIAPVGGQFCAGVLRHLNRRLCRLCHFVCHYQPTWPPRPVHPQYCFGYCPVNFWFVPIVDRFDKFFGMRSVRFLNNQANTRDGSTKPAAKQFLTPAPAHLDYVRQLGNQGQDPAELVNIGYFQRH